MNGRKLNVGSTQDNMDKYLIDYIKELRNNNQQVTILIILQKVFELPPLSKGEKYVPDFMELMKNWFYHGFKPQYNLGA